MAEQCFFDAMKECNCENKQKCPIMLQIYAKVVYCDDVKCLWNVNPLPFEKIVSRNRDYVPLSSKAFAKGLCGRPEILLSPKEIEAYGIKHKMATCAVRSDKEISGHMDFSRFPGKPGIAPDPIEPGNIYGGAPGAMSA